MISSHEDVWTRFDLVHDSVGGSFQRATVLQTAGEAAAHPVVLPGVAEAPAAAGGLGIDNFAFRYGGDKGQSEAQLAREYAAIPTDMLVMESAYDYTGGADVDFTAREVARIGADGKLVMAYMSIGSMDDRRDQFTSAVAAQAAQQDGQTIRGGPDEVFLRYWDESGQASCNPTLLTAYEGWIKSLYDKGYDGAYLDVMDSYYRPEVQADIPGATASEDYFIATGALLTIVKELKAYADALPGGRPFNLVLGHSPFLIQDYRQSGADTGQQADGSLISAVQGSVGAVVVETAVDFLHPNATTEQILSALAPGSPNGFGDADRLAITYDLGSADGLAYQVAAAEAGWRAYVAPNPAWAEGFTRTWPVFDVADGGPNALVARADAESLKGLAGDDLLVGDAAANRLEGDAGADTLDGGGGADSFAFLRLSDSANKHPDLITDLESRDTLDLSAIDADTGLTGDQAFELVRRFDGHAGELWVKYVKASDTTFIRADSNGDGKADLTIQVAGDHHGFSSFVL